jgi:hypothetical protein
MPLKKYFKGKGEKVMRDMKSRYGDEKGERIFYATVNSMKNESKGKAPKVKKQTGGRNPFFGNALPFQLGDGDRWISDDRKMGAMSFKGAKKGK